MKSENDEIINKNREEKSEKLNKLEEEVKTQVLERGKINENHPDGVNHHASSDSLIEQSNGDIGAETAKNYRYQHLWTTYIALEMLFNRNIIAVYCEYLDDITIELADDRLKVIQVKTKNTQDRKNFSLSDKKIGRTFDVFFSIEKRFQNKIVEYDIRTNKSFIRKKNSLDIFDVIAKFQRNSSKAYNEVYDFISGISSIKTTKNYDKNVIFQVFKKLKIPKYPESYEKLNQDIDAKIARILNRYNVYGENRRIPELKSRLMDLVYRKSSNDDYDLRALIYGIYPQGHKIKSLDAKESKKIEKSDVFLIFKDIVNEFNNNLENFNIDSQLDEDEKKSLKIIQKNLRLRINEVSLISKSSANGVVIRNGHVIRLKLTKLIPLITAVPKEIFNLSKLEFLSLASNQIKVIPNKIKQLCNLTELHLDHNYVSQLPEEINELKNLRILSISNNRIEEINGNILELENLQEFNISYNPLKSIIIEELNSNLKKLDLSFTSLSVDTMKLIKNTKIVYNNSDPFPYEKYCNSGKSYRFSFDDYNKVILLENGLGNFESPKDLAYFLKIHLMTMQKILRGLKTSITDYYKITFIRKSSNKIRHLQIPKNKILEKIQNIIHRDLLKNIDMGPHAYGFVKNRSARENAQFHLKSTLLINLDLKDFFTKITADHIIKGFINLGFSTGISAILTRLTTFTNVNLRSYLPQGTHSSPSIANIVFKPIDSELGKLANYNKFQYTRYGDDLSFSSLESRYAPKDFINQIFRIISKNKFSINEGKISFTRQHQKQVVTGVLVNGDECSLPRKTVKRIRAGLYQLENRDIGLKQKMHVYGMCRYALNINRNKYKYLLEIFKELEPEFEDDYANGVFHEEFNFLKELKYI